MTANSAPPLSLFFFLSFLLMVSRSQTTISRLPRHIRASAAVVDTATSSQAMNRHPNPVRSSIPASTVVHFFCSCPLLNSLFRTFLRLNLCLPGPPPSPRPPTLLLPGEVRIRCLWKLHQQRSARVRTVHSVFSCVVRRRSVQAVRHRWLSCGPSGASQLHGNTALSEPPGGAAQSGPG